MFFFLYTLFEQIVKQVAVSSGICSERWFSRPLDSICLFRRKRAEGHFEDSCVFFVVLVDSEFAMSPLRGASPQP